MDPNANLRDQLKLATKIMEEPRTEWVDPADAKLLAELVLALDEWISKGGFLPARLRKQ